MARAKQAFSSRKPGLMIQIYIHCTPGTGRTPLFMRLRSFRRRANPVILGFTYTRFLGNPEEIAAKEVTSGRHYQD
jgi:hypothetical protein